MKVRIKRLPNSPNFAYGGQQPGGALDVLPAAFGGNNYMGEAETGMEVKQSLTAVPRDEANLEAEGGETAFGPISGDTIPDHFKIKGSRHSGGGVPLSLPEDTFIFSDTKAMKIKDEGILKTFGKTKKKGGYTPADLAKPYDINKYKAILMDPNTDRKDRETAELMIKNYIMKLGALAIAQESKKGFPQGIPEMARPYMEANGITEDQLLPQQSQQSQEAAPAQQPMMKYGGLKTFQGDKDGSTVLNQKPKKGENQSDFMLRTLGNPGFAKSNKVWDGTKFVNNTQGSSIMSDSRSKELYEEKKKKNPNGPGGSFTGGWAEWEALSPQEQSPYLQKDIKGAFNNAKTLETTPSYKNATPQQKLLFESLTPEQRKMMVSTANQQQRGQQQLFGIGNQRLFGNQRGNRFGLPNNNPFANRAFQKDFSYLTPLRAPTYVGSGQPYIGGLPNTMPKSVGFAYRKNGLLKSLFNKDIARKEFVTTYNYGNTPGIKGVTTPFSVNSTLPDFTKYNNVQDVQDLNSPMSNRAFAREQTKTNSIRGGRFERRQERELRRQLDNGEITQEEFLALLEGNKANVPQVNDESNYTGVDSDGSNMMYVDPINPRPTNPGSESYNTTTINQPTESTSKIPGISMPSNAQNNIGNLATRPSRPINSVNNRNIIESNNKPIGNSFNSEMLRNRSMMDNPLSPEAATPEYRREYNPGLGNPIYKDYAFGGENEMLNAFVYGGNYAHGGFHNTNENYSSNFELGAADMTLDNPYDNPAENPYVNPLTGNQAAFVTNPGTGNYEMTTPQEGTDGDSFGVEFAQKVNNAYTFDGKVLDQQLEYAKNVGTRVGNTIKDAKEKKSIAEIRRQQEQDKYEQERTTRGVHYANNEGVMARNSISPTSVMSRMAEEGGSVKRVKILRKAQTGDAGKIGIDRAQEIYNKDKVVKGNIPESSSELTGVTVDGNQVFYDGTTGTTVTDPERRENSTQTTDPAKYKKDICAKIKNGGYSLDQAVKAGWISEGRSSEFAGCVSAEKTENVNYYVGEVEEAPEPGKKVCKCYKKDDAGNNIGEPISTTIINEGDPCPCEATITTEIEEELVDDPMQTPRYSDQDYRNLNTARRMKTNAAFASPTFVANAEMSPTLTEKYTSDITAGLAGNRAAVDNSRGSAADKLFMNLSGLDSSLKNTGQRAAQTEVTNAQILNQAAGTNYQGKLRTNQINAQTANTNALMNKNVLDTRMQANNARLQNINFNDQVANNTMLEKATNNYMNPEYPIGYRTGLPYKRTTYKDPALSKPAKTLAERVGELRENDYSEDGALKLALAEMKMAAKYGGFIPRYTTMPFDQ